MIESKIHIIGNKKSLDEIGNYDLETTIIQLEETAGEHDITSVDNWGSEITVNITSEHNFPFDSILELSNDFSDLTFITLYRRQNSKNVGICIIQNDSVIVNESNDI